MCSTLPKQDGGCHAITTTELNVLIRTKFVASAHHNYLLIKSDRCVIGLLQFNLDRGPPTSGGDRATVESPNRVSAAQSVTTPLPAQDRIKRRLRNRRRQRRSLESLLSLGRRGGPRGMYVLLVQLQRKTKFRPPFATHRQASIIAALEVARTRVASDGGGGTWLM